MSRYYDDELYHHGVLGMKWGVRRYQNPDGTLTEAGRRRFIRKEFSKRKQIDADKKEDKVENVDKSVSGVKTGIFNDRIREGSTLYRYSSSGNEIYDGRRIYASITNADRAIYRKDAMYAALSNKGKDLFLYELSASKNMKVAKGSKVVKDVVRTYGNKEIQDVYKQTTQADVRKNYHKLNKELRNPENPNHWMYDRVTLNQEKLNRFLHNTLYDKEKSKAIYDKYRKKGYDAIVDPEDYSDAYYYPLIVLNPEKSMNKKRVTRLR